VHGLQAFFGMPRRIRLVFKKNAEQLPCDLTGTVDETVCMGFVTEPRGVNYGVWRHPSSPYYKPKASSDEVSPVHAPEGRLGYRQWLGFVFDDDGKFPAKTIKIATSRLRNLKQPWRSSSRLFAGGYAMDNMKALAFAEAEMPLHDLDSDVEKEIQRLARLMVDGSSQVAKILGIFIKRAL
jgi:CRISPR system Cascade subunit CasA